MWHRHDVVFYVRTSASHHKMHNNFFFFFSVNTNLFATTKRTTSALLAVLTMRAATGLAKVFSYAVLTLLIGHRHPEKQEHSYHRRQT